MGNFSGASRWKINSQACWLFLFMATLMTSLLLPQPVLAQKEEVGLTLSLRNGQYDYNNEAMTGVNNRFFLEIRNTGTKPITNIRLSSEEPEGWIIEIKPAEISYLSSGSLETVDVNIKPPRNVGRGGYYVPFIAEASEIRKGQSFWVRVKLELELTLSLRNSQHDYYYNNEATAGQDNKFFLEVRNTGTKSITNIRLSAEEPEGWVIDFKPAEIDYLSPGSLQTVDVNIKLPRNVGRGGHEINFFAEANEIHKVQRFWVTVKMASLWVWVGVGGVLIVVAAFVLIYMRFGRQKSET